MNMESVLFRAGAGAGKTHRLIESIVEYAKKFHELNGEYPRMVVTTFTKKATQEIRERLILKAQDEDHLLLQHLSQQNQVFISTIHGVLSLFLNRFGYMLNVDPYARVISTRQETRLARGVLKNILFDSDHSNLLESYSASDLVTFFMIHQGLMKSHPQYKFYSQDDLNLALANLDGDLAKEYLGQKKLWPDYLEVFKSFEALSLKFGAAFDEFKRLNGFISIGDLELITGEAIRHHPEAAKLFSQEWDYWFIDEFQDTSPIQNEILKKLIGDRNYFVVGDPQQSIYLFRGARSKVFLDCESEFKKNKHAVHHLSTNWRSQPSYVSFFNDLFSSQTQFLSMDPKEGEFTRESVATFFSAASEEEERKGIVRHIKKLMALNVPLENICVLARTNQTLKEIARELGQHQVPHYLHAAGGFSGRREILDALSLLKFLCNPHDNTNFIRLLRSPFYHIDDEDIVSITLEAPDSYWLAVMKKYGDSDATVARLRDLLIKAQSEGIGNVFRQALVSDGILLFSKKIDPSGRREANLWKLMAQLKEAESRSGFNYIQFVESIIGSQTEEEESDAVASAEPKNVNLMTVHRSKGLQFEHVIIPRAGRKPWLSPSPVLLPDESKSRLLLSVPDPDSGVKKHLFIAEETKMNRQEQELLEGQRLFYVAITRAISSVFVSWSGEIEKNSWLSQVGIDLSLGVHQKQRYSYEVVQEVPVMESGRKTSSSISVRPPFRGTKQSLTAKRKSVTELIGKDLFRSPKNENLMGMEHLQRGVMIHRLLESLAYLDIESVRDRVPHMFGNQAPTALKVLDYVLKEKDIPLLDLIKQGHAEWGFILKENEISLEGQIDLWGQVQNQTWILDYKSGSERFSELAFQQLNLYSLAVRKTGVTGRINLAVVYPLENKCLIREASSEEEVKKFLLSAATTTGSAK